MHVLADAEPVKKVELKDDEAIDVEELVVEEAAGDEQPKQPKKSSFWRRFLAFLHIITGYFSVLCWCTFLLFLLKIKLMCP